MRRRKALNFVDAHALAITAAFAFIGLIAIMLWLYFGAGSLRIERARVRAEIHANRAARQAERTANATAKYDACVRSIPELKKLNRFVRGVKDEHSYLYAAALDAFNATPPGDPLYPVRKRNVRRARQAFADVRVVSPFKVPSKSDCDAVRDAALAK